jgi:hypothetical protein
MQVYFHLKKCRCGGIVMQTMRDVLTLEDRRLAMQLLGMVCYLGVEAGYNRLWRCGDGRGRVYGFHYDYYVDGVVLKFVGGIGV